MSEVSALVPTVTTGPLQRIGDLVDVPSGRRYKYTKFGNTAAIAAGAHVYAVVTTSSALAITSVANGQLATNLVAPSQQLQVVTTGAVVADAYQGGYALVTANGGADKYSLRITHNTGTAAAGNITLLFEESLPNTVALVPGTDTVTLSTSPDIASTTTSTGNIDCGYTVNAIPAQTAGTFAYGYTQVSGYNAIVPGLTNIQ
jgi:hypothetical protein